MYIKQYLINFEVNFNIDIKVRPQRELQEVHPWCDKIFEKKSADDK